MNARAKQSARTSDELVRAPAHDIGAFRYCDLGRGVHIDPPWRIDLDWRPDGIGAVHGARGRPRLAVYCPRDGVVKVRDCATGRLDRQQVRFLGRWHVRAAQEIPGNGIAQGPNSERGDLCLWGGRCLGGCR